MTNHDDILDPLGRHLREEGRTDALFERIARGEASAEELAQVEREADADPELAVRLEASRPLDDVAVDRIAARLSLGASPVAGKARARKEPAGNTPPVAKPSVVRRLFVTAGPLALAAGLILYVIAGPRVGSSGPALPDYAVSAQGVQAMRGAPDPVGSTELHLVRGKDARFEIVLRPATAPAEKVVAFAFAMGEKATEPSPLEARVDVAAEGAVRLTGSSRLLDGVREVRVVIGTPAAIGKFDDATARAATAKSERDVRVVTVPVRHE